MTATQGRWVTVVHRCDLPTIPRDVGNGSIFECVCGLRYRTYWSTVGRGPGKMKWEGPLARDEDGGEA